MKKIILAINVYTGEMISSNYLKTICKLINAKIDEQKKKVNFATLKAKLYPFISKGYKFERVVFIVEKRKKYVKTNLVKVNKS